MPSARTVETIKIGNQIIPAKGYYCSPEGEENYPPKEKSGLWLYIHITNACNGRCVFCVNACERQGSPATFADPARLRDTLKIIFPFVDGVSITGGEPMLDPGLVDEMADAVSEYLPEAALDLVTNGTNFAKIPELKRIGRFEGIHLSRHCLDDEANNALMGLRTPTWEEIGSVVQRLEDPAQIVLNCVLQKGGVEKEEDVRDYLERAADAGVKNTSFIGMFPANDYCRENYVLPSVIAFAGEGMHRWNWYHDHDICSCSSGSYTGGHGTTRFYYRCPGQGTADYVRQLVYMPDGRLLSGFGGEELMPPLAGKEV